MSPHIRFSLALAALIAAAPAAAQNFVKITDPSNPVVNDSWQSGGACWIDLVGDGYLDLFVANGNLTNQPNSLYRNNRAGGFVKVLSGPVVTDGGSSIGGTIGDFDNDGHTDLFVTNRSAFGNFLYRGLGDTNFVKVTTGTPVTDKRNSNMSSWVDADNDGDLDLSVVNFQDVDFFYRNDGTPGFVFTRVDTMAMIPGTEFSIPEQWADMNNDGRDDLFIGNAGTQSDYLYTNRGGLWFTRTIIADGQSSLGASWGDFDNDGDLDLFVAHYSSQKSKLYRNGGPPLFQLAPIDTGIVSNEFGLWTGSGWGDFDNDGDLDLFVGYDGGGGALYRNNGPPDYGFTRITTGAIASEPVNAFGIVWGDYDRDGQLDLFVADHNGNKNRLFHNLGGTSNHWITIRCAGTTSNRSAIGAKVCLFSVIGGVPRLQLREVTGQTGYNSQNLDQHFGLGSTATIDSIRVDWPSGLRETWRNVQPDIFLKLTEGASLSSAPGPTAPVPSGLRVGSVRPNPFARSTEIEFELPRAGRATLALFDVAGRRVAQLVDADLAEGVHAVRFDAADELPAGLYFLRLAWGGAVSASRILHVR